MKKLASLLLCVILLATAIPGFAAEEEPLRKVIFDTDILYLSDDAVAMFMLATADSRKELELLSSSFLAASSGQVLMKTKLFRRGRFSRSTCAISSGK